MCKTVSKLLPLFLLALLWGLPLYAEELSEEQIKEISALWDDAQRLLGEEDYQSALKITEQVLDKLDQWRADEFSLYAWQELEVKILMRDQQYPTASKKQKELLSLTKDLFGDQDPETIVAKVNLNDFEKFAALTPEQQKELSEGEAAYHAAVDEADLEKAIDLGEQMAAKEKKYLGEDCTWYTNSLSLLAGNYIAAKKYKQAEATFRNCLRLTERLFGENHFKTREVLENMTLFYVESDFPHDKQVLNVMRRLLALQEQTLGMSHESTMITIEFLATKLFALGAQKKLKSFEELLYFQRKIYQYHRSKSPKRSLYDAHFLSTILREAGRFDESIAVCKDALHRSKTMQLQHEVTHGLILLDLAHSYFWKKEFKKTFEVCEMALPKLIESGQTLEESNCLTIFSIASAEIGKIDDAVLLKQRDYENQKALYGENDLRTLSSLKSLAIFTSKIDTLTADVLLERYLSKSSESMNTNDPRFIRSLWHVASVQMSYSPSKALPTAKKALLLAREAGAEPLLLARIEKTVAATASALGHYDLAEAMYINVINRTKDLEGKLGRGIDAPEIGLGLVYIHMGKNKKAIDILNAAIGNLEGENLAMALNNIGIAYLNLGKPDKSLDCHQKALVIDTRNAQAATSSTLRQYFKWSIAADHHGIANAYLMMMKPATAVIAANESIKVLLDAAADVTHPIRVARARCTLGNALCMSGKFKEAQTSLDKGIEQILILNEMNSTIQSERQQLVAADQLKYALCLHLCTFLELDEKYDDAYPTVLASKGTVTRRQQLMRSFADSPELEPLFAKLQSTASQLSTAYSSNKQIDPKLREKRISELTKQKEAIEQQLSRQSQSFRQAMREVPPQDLQTALPQNSVLIDFVEYSIYERDKSDQKTTNKIISRLAAFIIRPEGPIELVDLCSREDLQLALFFWKENLGRNTGPATDLGKLIWEPLAPYVDDAEVVLYSPVGELGSVPFAALPGKEPGSYLLEEKQLVMIPQAKLLPSLLEREQAKKPTVLAIGGVDYESVADNETEEPVQLAASRRAVRWNDEAVFTPLPETEIELDAIGKLYNQQFDLGKLQTLKDDRATEAAVKRLAPQYSHLHFATHGFFAPPEVKSALDNSENRFERQLSFDDQPRFTGFHPGLLSGLALAGANDPPEEGEDGIWTAEEVATMNLSKVDLAVLSACETGLGKVAGGEGLLGLQRAFQVSGAGTTVASLWQVDDAATRALMDEFYRNLWEKKLPKIEALRQAQLKMLREYDPQKGTLRGVGGVRQLDTDGQPDRLPPSYWAAWVLSGDWR